MIQRHRQFSIYTFIFIQYIFLAQEFKNQRDSLKKKKENDFVTYFDNNHRFDVVRLLKLSSYIFHFLFSLLYIHDIYAP